MLARPVSMCRVRRCPAWETKASEGMTYSGIWHGVAGAEVSAGG
ncbi:hypothetical protein [Phytomonospora endophytica]|uniref:Uncharacterized protein n=1 Tax=Phytomonospora endophytica TaxID=714109 RepID=A0A841G1Z6_9ACTN|nr:hypothetical protein [Phytomonospora endophytica]MBB6038719.1 hypothetical protein [Phytomonospora endophytica]